MNVIKNIENVEVDEKDNPKIPVVIFDCGEVSDM